MFQKEIPPFWEISILRLPRNFWEHLSSSPHLRGDFVAAHSHARVLCQPLNQGGLCPSPGCSSGCIQHSQEKNHSSLNKFITEDVSGGHRPKLFAKKLEEPPSWINRRAFPEDRKEMAQLCHTFTFPQALTV